MSDTGTEVAQKGTKTVRKSTGFQKGHKKYGGRQEGTKNQYTQLKDDIIQVWSDIDGHKKLVEYASKNPKQFIDFVKIAVDLLPKEVRSDVNLNLQTLIEDVRKADERTRDQARSYEAMVN